MAKHLGWSLSSARRGAVSIQRPVDILELRIEENWPWQVFSEPSGAEWSFGARFRFRTV
jgi:hypothetical protein